MTRGALVLALSLLACAWRQPADPRAQVRVHIDAGRLEDAERVARAGGPAISAALGEVLVLRGRLAEADSVFRGAIQQDAAGRRTAEVSLAELALRRGDRADALRRAVALTVAYKAASARWSADDQVAAGRAYVLLGAGDAASVRQALSSFDNAVAIDSSNIEARLRAGDLLLEKYNAPDARTSFEDVLKRAPENARAMLGMARIADFEGKTESMALVRKSIAANPSLVPAQVQLARLHLEAEAYDSATTVARRALAVDSSSIGAWSLIAASAWLTGDSALFRSASAAARRLNPRPADFYAELAEAAARQRRYADGVRWAREAMSLDSSSVRALGLVGTNELRAGRIEEGRAVLERAFAIDPFNLWHKNTLDLLDELKKFTTIDRGHFQIVAPPEEAQVLSLYLFPLLEEAYDSLSKRYGYRPSSTVRMEIYRRHADFSVRTVGLAGLGALGVSFGPVLAMDAPSARERGQFNWGSVAWHELAHTFTLGLSGNRAPRWLSEGLSVLEERRARSGWGATATIDFLAAYAGGKLRKVSQLNDGFVRPRAPSEVIHSYYLASLVCEMVEQQYGSKALVDMLTAYRDGLETPEVFAKVLERTPAQLDEKFDTWFRAKFAVPLRNVASDDKGEPAGPFVQAVRAAIGFMGQNPDSARVALLRAQAMFPDYAGSGSPAEMLAILARDRGDYKEALQQIMRVTRANETAWDANLLEAELRERLGDTVGARAPLERLLWISPYDVSVHNRLAVAAAKAGDHGRAVSERRAVLALDPSDPLDARYALARSLADAGDVAGARRELLNVLERAPSFEKAQALLLDLRNKSQSGGRP